MTDTPTHSAGRMTVLSWPHSPTAMTSCHMTTSPPHRENRGELTEKEEIWDELERQRRRGVPQPDRGGKPLLMNQRWWQTNSQCTSVQQQTTELNHLTLSLDFVSWHSVMGSNKVPILLCPGSICITEDNPGLKFSEQRCDVQNTNAYNALLLSRTEASCLAGELEHNWRYLS